MKKHLLALSIALAVPTLSTDRVFSQPIRQIEWHTSTNGLDIEDRLDQDFTFLCPSGGSVHTVYGTDLYEYSSSICTAAVHSGLINVRDGGRVTLRIRPGADFYNPSVRHNITSRRSGSASSSFVFLDANGQPMSPDRQVRLIEWNHTASDISARLDQEFTFDCPKNGVLGSVYGTDLYSYDSSICTAAVHRGIISSRRGGRVTILIRAGAASYRGTSRNGVSSRNNSASGSSFSFVTQMR